MAADHLTPEGFDDYQTEGSEQAQIEVKSRQLRLGPFPTKRGSTEISKSMVRHWRRFESARKLKLVFEQGLVGFHAVADNGVRSLPLIEVLEAVPGLREAVAKQIERSELSSSEAETLTSLTEVIIGTWDDFLQDTESHIHQIAALPPAALSRISLSLRSLIADTVDANAEATFAIRARLDRTKIVETINETAALLDIDSLEGALTQGICSPLEWVPLATGDAYYEGVSTQPGHVAAGLVVPRPDLTEKVLNGLEAGKSVLLAGPSGVGKSAVLWALPSAIPGVVWFRLSHLSDEELSDVERLVRAYATSPRWSVGLLADAVGSGEFEAWSRLRERISTIPGALLVGTARREDLFALGGLADCHIVTVALDEPAAGIIHTGLLRRGATAVPHWREAFEQSDGLTMEFTYLLTRGARLRDVIADQVADRMREGRELELQILALASTADRWSASMPTHKLQETLEIDAFGLQAAMARLVDEHLLVDQGGSVAGVHQVRSRAISEAIHEHPPPRLLDTVGPVLRMLQGDELSRFVYEALRDSPDLDASVLGTLKDMAMEDIKQLPSGLHALEMVDFHRQASAWAEITERHNVPQAHRPLVLEFAMAGLDFPDVFPPSFLAASGEIRDLSMQSTLRDELLKAIGLLEVAGALDTASDAGECARLLQAVRNTSLDSSLLLGSFARPSALASVLEQCETTQLSECVEAARTVSVPLAEAVVEAAGGIDSVLQRIRKGDPWIRELRIESVDGRLTGVARYFYIAPEEQGDARERSVELGGQLLRLLPSIEQVDIKPLGPNGEVIMFDGHEIASSGLLRRYDQGPAAVSWNRQRFHLVQSQFGVSETERLSELVRLLDETACLCRDYGAEFVKPSGRFSESRKLNERRLRVDRQARLIPPPRGADPFQDSPDRRQDGDLSFIITNITDKGLPRLHLPEQWMALSAWLSDTVLRKNIEACRALEWRLLGRDGPPLSLSEISKTMSDIDAVLRELIADSASTGVISSEARRGNRSDALARAAEVARFLSGERRRQRRAEVEVEMRTTVGDLEFHWLEVDLDGNGPGNFAVGVPVDSLIEWGSKLDLVVGEIERLRDPTQSPFIVPILRGRTAWRIGVRLAQQLWPALKPGPFEQLMPDPIEECLTVEVNKCHSALQILSALSVLANDGDIDRRLEPVVVRARQDFADASSSILELGGDAVVLEIADWVRMIAERVNAEWEGKAEPGEYAASVQSGAHAHAAQSEEFGTLSVALALSVEWDSDPVGALETLEAVAS